MKRISLRQIANLVSFIVIIVATFLLSPTPNSPRSRRAKSAKCQYIIRVVLPGRCHVCRLAADFCPARCVCDLSGAPRPT